MTTNIQSFAGDVQIDNGNLSVKTLEVKDGITKLGSNNTTYSNVGVMMTRKDGASNVAFLFTEDGANVVLGYTNDEALDDDRIDVLQDEKANLVVYGNVYVSGSVHGDGSTLTGLVTTLQSVTNFGAETNKTILFTNQNTGINVSSNVLVSGNVSANVYYGDGGLLSNITQTLEGITAIGNNTPYTLEFENDETAFVTLANVGIINTNPTSDLCIGSNVVFDDDGYDTLQVKGNVNAYEFHMQSITILPGYGLENVTEISNTTPNTISITNSTLSLITDSKVGIGIAPTTLDVGASGLHVDGHVRLGGAAGSNENQQLYVKSGGALGVMANTDDTDNQNTSLLLQSGATNNSNITLDGNSTDKYISFGTNTLERMRITDDGLGVSTTTPSSNLHVEGNTYISGNTQVGAGYLFVDTDTGNVGIGKTNPQYDIDVLGNINFTGAFYQGGSPFISTPWTITGDDIYYLKPGYVGIGTNSTGSNLQVSGNVYVDSYDAHSTTYGGVVINGGLAVSSNIHTSNIYAGNVYISDVYVSTSPDLDSVCAEGASTSRAMSITNETESTTNDSGALTVDGGIGVSGNIHCSNLYTSNALIVSNVYAGNVYASNLVLDDVWLDVSPDLQAVTTSGNSTTQSFFTTSTEPSTSPTTGAIQVRGGAGMQGNVYVGSNVYIQGGGLELTQVSNTFQITSSSNVVTEYVRSKKFIKYPRVAMTAATSGGYTASASSTFSGYHPWRVFDNNNPVGGNSGAGAGWAAQGPGAATDTYNSSTGAEALSTTHHPGSQQGEWLQIQMPDSDSMYLYDMVIHSRSETTYTDNMVGFPKNVYLYGSNDNSNWTILKNFTTVSKIGGASHTESIDYTRGAFNYFAIVINSIHVSGTDVGWASIGQIELYGIPEYDPDAHGTGVIARSVPNVPNTDWLEVYYDGQDYTSMPSSVTDKSGNGVTGTPESGVGFDTEYKAFTFPGGSTNETIYNSSFTPSGGDYVHSVSLWFYASALDSTPQNLFWFGNLAANQGSFLKLKNNLIAWDTVNSEYDYDMNLTNNTWYHVVMTYSGGGMANHKVYVNGACLQNPTLVGSANQINIPTSTSLILAHYINSGNVSFVGKIANFRLFNRALTADEMWQLYAYQKDYFQVSPDVVTFKGGRLGIGTLEPRAVLDVNGDLYARGSVVQVEQGIKTNTASTSTTGFVDTGLEVTIRPKSSSSKILVSYAANIGTNTSHAFLRLVRVNQGSDTVIAIGDAGGNRVQCTHYIRHFNDQSLESHCMEFLDSPSTTSAVTYKLQYSVAAISYTVYMNRAHSDGNNAYYGRGVSTITAKEIAQ